MKKLLNVCFALVITVFAFSQEIGQYSQYIYTQGLLNPAYVGSRDAVSGLLLYRYQWAGIDGAPKTMAFNIHSPIGKKGLGLGLSVVNDQIGPDNKTSVSIAASYKLKFDNRTNLMFGLQTGIDMQSSNLISEIEKNAVTVNEELVAQKNENHLGPNVGFGVYYYNEKKFFIGFSTPSILNTGVGKADTTQASTSYETKFDLNQLTTFLYGGYIFDVGARKEIKIKPTFLWKQTMGAPVNYEVGLNVLLKRVLWLGAAYRSEDAVVLLIDYKISNNFSVGYSYDLTLSELKTDSGGSHEVRLGFDFDLGRSFTGKVSPRYF